MRHEMQLLKTRLEKDKNWQVTLISLAELVWQSIDETEGMDAITALERSSGFPTAQSQVYEYLSDPDWRPLPDLLAERLSGLDSKKDLVFLWRAGALCSRDVSCLYASRQDERPDIGFLCFVYAGYIWGE